MRLLLSVLAGLSLALLMPRPASALASQPQDLRGSLLGSPLGIPGGGSPIGGGASASGLGLTGIASSAATGLALATVGDWVTNGATSVLHETGDVLSETTTPRLGSTWFSATYWRVAGVAAVLTLPFLFAAAVQALLRSDLSLLLRAALGYLPLSMLAVGIAAPLTMLLLSASDELAAVVSSAASHQSGSFLKQAVLALGGLGAASVSPFVAFLVGLLIVAGALMLWIELLMREAAVYVVVLMLPLAFAAFVWPARRVWAIRSLELLAALILSKFAIVAVLSLGGAALGHSAHSGLSGLLAGVVLLALAAFTPWALLRLLPLAEIAAGTAGALRGHSGSALRALQQSDSRATDAERWLNTTARMRSAARDVDAAAPQPRLPEPAARPAGQGTANGGAPAEPAPGQPAPAAESAPGPESAPAPDSPAPAGPAPAPDSAAGVENSVANPPSGDPAPVEPPTQPGQWIVSGKLERWGLPLGPEEK